LTIQYLPLAVATVHWHYAGFVVVDRRQPSEHKMQSVTTWADIMCNHPHECPLGRSKSDSCPLEKILIFLSFSIIVFFGGNYFKGKFLESLNFYLVRNGGRVGTNCTQKKHLTIPGNLTRRRQIISSPLNLAHQPIRLRIAFGRLGPN